ncbi:MAG TPA: spore germination protein [Tenericutes bacterium]|nr:spore germination protein [Mycoplasmatota bacterium]
MNNDIKKNILDKIGNSEDVKIRSFSVSNNTIDCIYFESICSGDKINSFVLKSISRDYKNNFKIDDYFQYLKNSVPHNNINILSDVNDMLLCLNSGFLIIIINNQNVIAAECKAELDRSISPSTTEPTLRGAKDSFTENFAINIGLIRRRIKDHNLRVDSTLIGKRTKTKVGILYLKDVVENYKIKKIKKILDTINIDGLSDSGYIKQFIDRQKSVFPKILSTERPDLASMSLLEGKIVIIVENSPFCLILPCYFSTFFHNPEDYYQSPINSSFNRLIRVVGFFITLLLPALYIALMTYENFIIPEELMITLASQRINIPYPTAFEVIVLEIIFEIIRECDTRIPSDIGTSISIVGGLVLGDAAVSANLVSPMVVLVIAITSVANLLFNDIDFVNAIRFWRFMFIFFAAASGITGILVCGIIFIIKLSSLEILGNPYVAPFSPYIKSEQVDNIIIKERSKFKKRSVYISSKNINRIGDNNEEI